MGHIDAYLQAVKRRLPLLLAFAVECRTLPWRAAELQSATQDRDNREPIRRAMGEQFPDTPPSVRPPEDRLDSWKEIAAYLNRDVTTVQRWEKREGMPVHRHLHDRMGSVYAYRAELDTWTRSRNLRAAQDNENNASLGTCTGSSIGLDDSDLSQGGSLSCRWRRQSSWRLAQTSGFRGRSTSGVTRSLRRDSRPSRTSMERSRLLRCHATVISWPFCRTATDRWTSG